MKFSPVITGILLITVCLVAITQQPLSAHIPALRQTNHQTDTLIIQPMMNGAPLRLNSAYNLASGQDVVVNKVQWYCSDIQFLHRGKAVHTLPTRHHLVSFERGEWALPLQGIVANAAAEIDSIRFCVGVDSLTSVSGAFGGNLDPTRGMYWTWQSGYINVKIEGSSPLCPTRNNAFQFHLGGYQAPHNALQTVTLQAIMLQAVTLQNITLPATNRLPATKGNHIRIYLDLAGFFANINLAEQHHIMSPSLAAVRLSKIFAQSFSVEKPQPNSPQTPQNLSNHADSTKK